MAIRELSCHNRENHTGISWTRATKEELHSNIWQKKCSTVGAHRTLILIVFVGKKGGQLQCRGLGRREEEGNEQVSLRSAARVGRHPEEMACDRGKWDQNAVREAYRIRTVEEGKGEAEKGGRETHRRWRWWRWR